MENKTNLLSKLAQARVHIKSKNLKKDGTNEYSKYSYYTPEYVDRLVTDACIEADIMCVFNLECDQYGYYGEVITYDLEDGNSLRTVIRTEKPNITATNATQQMGGMNTYTKRYALMSLFCIEDNTIDFDAQKPTTQQSTIPAPKLAAPNQDDDGKQWLNKYKADKTTITDEWTKVVAALQSKEYTLAQVEGKYKLARVLKQELLAL
jgi:hypothetical protein